MAEVTRPGDEHGAIDGIDGGDRVGVAHRSAGLHEGPYAGGQADLDGIREREERVAGAGGPDRASTGRAWRGPWRRRRAAASTRDVWPLPMPTRRPSRTSTMAFEVTPRTSRQARSRSSCSPSVGARRVAHVHVVGRSARMSGAVTRTAPPTLRSDPTGEAASSGGGSSEARPSSSRTRRFGFPARMARASSSYAGATTTSRNSAVRAVATAASTSRVRATTPPNALTGSASRAAVQASSRVVRSAAPHGLVCLTMTTPGPRSARPSADAAAASRTLLYESALPCSGARSMPNGPSARPAPGRR